MSCVDRPRSLSMSPTGSQTNIDVSDRRRTRVLSSSASPREKPTKALFADEEGDPEDMVTFIVEGKPIKVSRRTIEGVEVFEAMFSSVMKEGVDATVEVPNYLFSIVRKMLSFIETDYVFIENTAEALEILRAADQYQVLRLKSFCIDYIKQHASMENIEDVVQLGCLLQIPDLSNILDAKHQDTKKASFFSIPTNNTTEIQTAAIRSVLKDYAFAIKKFCFFMEQTWPALVTGFKSVLLKSAICNKAGDEKMARLLLNLGAKPEVEHLFLAINIGESMLSLLLKCSYAAINDFGDNQRLMKPLDWALESLGAPHLNGFVMIGNTNNSPNRRLSMSNINKSDLEIKEIADETIGPEEEKDKINADNIVSLILMYMTKQDPSSVTWRQMCKIVEKDLVKSTEIALNSKEWKCSMFPSKSCEERRFSGVKGCKEFHQTVNNAYSRALETGNEEIIIVLLLNGVVKAHQHYVFRLIEKGFVKALEIWCSRGLDISQRDNCYRGRGRCHTYHRTPLEFALQKGRMDIAKLLIHHDPAIIRNSTLHSLVKLQQKRTRGTPNHSRRNSSEDTSSDKESPSLSATPIIINKDKEEKTLISVLSIMKELIGLGADVNLTFWETKRTPLHLAILKGDLHVTQFLVENGADVNAVNTVGESALHLALELGAPHTDEGKLEIIRYLIEHGAYLEMETAKGERPLHLAVLQRSVPIVSYLTEQGADVNIPLRGDMTPLHFAALEGECKLLCALLATKNHIDLYKRDKENKMCLHYAVGRDDNDMVNFLLDRQPISSFVDVELLDLAADKGNKRIVTLLVEVAVHTANHREEIAVWALKRRYYHILRDLLKAGCDPNAVVDLTTNDTLLHLACRQGRVQVVRGLIHAKADVQRVNKYNWTPLFEAAKGGFADVVAMLIGAGADVEHWDKQGRTPFIVAQSAKVEEKMKDYETVLNLLEDAAWGQGDNTQNI